MSLMSSPGQSPDAHKGAGASAEQQAPESAPTLESPNTLAGLRLNPQLQIDFKVPAAVKTAEAFIAWASSHSDGVHKEIGRIVDEGTAQGNWTTLTPKEKGDLSFACRLIAEEGIANLIGYGIADLTQAQRDGVFGMRLLGEREGGLAKIQEGLDSGAIHSRSAAMLVEFDANAVCMRFRDSIGFPDFDARVAERRAWQQRLLTEPDLVDESPNGRGLMLMISYFETVYLDPSNQDRVCELSIAGLKAMANARASRTAAEKA